MITRTRCNVTSVSTLHVMLTRQHGILSSRFLKRQTPHHCHSCLPHRVNTCPESRVCLVPLIDILHCFATLPTHQNIQCVSLATEPGISLIILTLMRILGALQTNTTDIFLLISHTTNVPLFKFRCNIFIYVRIIKEMPGSVASGTHCIMLSGSMNGE
jgi:hypothetical protein